MHMKWMRFFACILFFAASDVTAQFSFKKTDSVQVFNFNNQKLQLAFAGGFNYMQFSEIDLNYDGINDLFAFDRSSNKITTFINQNIPDSISYSYSPEYIKYFPNDLKSWALLRDYNGDGKADIFTQNTGGIKVYRNTGAANNGLQFTYFKDKIYTKYNATDSLPLFVTSVDIPSISDIDNDGDIDIVTFSANSYYAEYHKNKTKEKYSNTDSLEFEASTVCFGNFKEDQSNCDIFLNQPCFNKSNDAVEKDINHSGSAILAFDVDNDHDQDLLISDISCNTIKHIVNGGDSAVANATSIDINYPSYSTPIQQSIFPCPFLIDVNNDGKKDLVMSPNSSTGSENTHSVMLYNNTSNNASYTFNFAQDNFLQGEMIDNGEGAFPAFFDYNNDGLKDFILGNTGRYANGELRSRLMLFQNIGNANYPKYKIINEDFLNFSSVSNINNLACTFGDLDADNDADLIIGNANGELLYYENTPVSGISNFTLADPNYQGIDIGYNAAPQLVDVNRDNLLDILIGTSVGRIKYYQNIGTAQAAQFVLITSTFGNVFTGMSGIVLTDGYCTPQLFDVNGSYHLLCGSKVGRIFSYDNIDGNLNGAFDIADTNYLYIWEGRNSSLAIADINNDGQKDLLVGNISGGLNYYSGDITGNIQQHDERKFSIQVFPNPASNIINITSDAEIINIEIYNINGATLWQQSSVHSKKISISTEQITQGMYIVKCLHAAGISYSKIMIKN